MITVGDALLLARRREKLSQDDLAQALGVSFSFVSQVERGHKRFPPEQLSKLPASIRQDVADALVAEHEAAIAAIRANVPAEAAE